MANFAGATSDIKLGFFIGVGFVILGLILSLFSGGLSKLRG